MTHPLADRDPALRWSRALAHPLRARIVRHLTDRDAATPTDIAHALNSELGVVCYHIRRLVALQLVTLQGTTKARGRTQHHYRLTDRNVAIEVLTLTAFRSSTAVVGRDLDAIDVQRLQALGRTVAERRIAQGMPTDVLAAQAGIDPADLERIERGEADPTATVLARVADALGTTIP